MTGPLPPDDDVMGDNARCIHCGDWVVWQKDPAPDLCAVCYSHGKVSPMWQANEQEYLELWYAAIRPRPT
jgi:hypothetical protein